MAQRTRTVVLDDLTGEQLGEDAVRVTFSLEGIDVPSRGRISAALMERYENR